MTLDERAIDAGESVTKCLAKAERMWIESLNSNNCGKVVLASSLRAFSLELGAYTGMICAAIYGSASVVLAAICRAVVEREDAD